jgi:hypothetical protein
MRRLRLQMMAGGIITPLLLDLYPGAIGAWSLRKLRNGYSGSAIRVRRASDNAEQNIGFDINGDLDTTALTAFCTGTNGFVTTWYDQSGNNKNALQTTAISQPKIHDSVTGVLTQNGKPAASFDGINDFFLCGLLNGGTKPSNFSSFNVSKFNTLAGGEQSICASIDSSGTNASSYALFLKMNNASTMAVSAGNSANSGQYIIGVSTTNSTTNQQLNGQIYISGNNTIFYSRDGLGQSMSYPFGQPYNQSIGTEFQFAIGRQGESSSRYFNGNQQENIVYPLDLTSTRAALETNIKTYYGIP